MVKNIFAWIGAILVFGGGYLFLLFAACMDGFAPTTNPLLRIIYDIVLLPLLIYDKICALFRG